VSRRSEVERLGTAGKIFELFDGHLVSKVRQVESELHERWPPHRSSVGRDGPTLRSGGTLPKPSTRPRGSKVTGLGHGSRGRGHPPSSPSAARLRRRPGSSFMTRPPPPLRPEAGRIVGDRRKQNGPSSAPGGCADKRQLAAEVDSRPR
jgi:hypothetical protein